MNIIHKKNRTLVMATTVLAVIASYIILSSEEPAKLVNASENRLLTPHSLNTHSQATVTTVNILGYESAHGLLPASLKGTTLDNALQVDEDGHLLISTDIKDLFDYFLSTITEESLDTILLRINEYLAHYLQEPALSESQAILTQYVEFKYSLMDLEKEMGEDLAQMSHQEKVNGGYVTFLQKQMQQRNALRAQHLDIEVHEAFYEAEERYDEYTYEKLLVTSNKELSDSERFNQIAELQSSLPEDVKQSIRDTQITDELKIRTEQLLANGGDQQQIRELRREMFGDDAVQRFDELDQQRAEWNARVNSYLAQRANIQNNPGLPIDELNLQIDTLRASLFDAQEQIRVRSIERNTKT
jgi:lipase chaperone LimK